MRAEAFAQRRFGGDRLGVVHKEDPQHVPRRRPDVPQPLRMGDGVIDADLLTQGQLGVALHSIYPSRLALQPFPETQNSRILKTHAHGVPSSKDTIPDLSPEWSGSNGLLIFHACSR